MFRLGSHPSLQLQSEEGTRIVNTELVLGGGIYHLKTTEVFGVRFFVCWVLFWLFESELVFAQTPSSFPEVGRYCWGRFAWML